MTRKYKERSRYSNKSEEASTKKSKRKEATLLRWLLVNLRGKLSIGQRALVPFPWAVPESSFNACGGGGADFRVSFPALFLAWCLSFSLHFAMKCPIRHHCVVTAAPAMHHNLTIFPVAKHPRVLLHVPKPFLLLFASSFLCRAVELVGHESFG